MRFIFHVGAHKTGSTLIQGTVRKASTKSTNDPIVRIGRTAMISPSHPIAKEFARGIDRSYADRAPRSDAVAALNELVASIPDDIETVVYSNENMFGGLGHVEPFYDRADNALDVIAASDIEKPEFALYVRSQADWLVSWFGQYSPLKRSVDAFGATLSFMDFLNMIDLESLSWLALAEKMAGRFGDDSLTVVPFELIRESGAQGFLDDFSQRFFEGSPLPADPSSHQRSALSKRAMNVLLAAKPYLTPQEIGGLTMYLERLNADKDEPKAYALPPLFKSAILEAHNTGNRTLFDRFVPTELHSLLSYYQPTTRTC